MKVLVHACCGPCSVYPAEALRAEGLEFTWHFFNPNIHPYQEYERRREALRDFTRREGIELVEDDYEPEIWFRAVAFRENERCGLCYRLRLGRTAHAARRGGFAAFTSTLLYSIFQKHELVREAAEAAAREAGVPFLYRDFRRGWQAGREAWKELGWYRQKYCGCLFSERERFQKKRKGAVEEQRVSSPEAGAEGVAGWPQKEEKIR